MRHLRGRWRTLLSLTLAAVLTVSCDMMTEDLSDCPTGLYMTFRYDYNLDEANAFSSQVGSVTLLVYDTDDRLVATYEESNTDYAKPLASDTYTMHITDLPEGEYRFIVLAQQAEYTGTRSDSRALFNREGTQVGSNRTDLDITLERIAVGDGEYEVDNNGMPLDTLWYGRNGRKVDDWLKDADDPFVMVYNDRPTYDTIYMMRDMNEISVTLRELDDPTTMDINDYSLSIRDHNARLLWDNSVDETDAVTYTPYATWNDEDAVIATDAQEYYLEGVGKIGHADFMVSRLVSHDDVDDDAVLTIVNQVTGETVASLNLPSLLARTRNYGLIGMYTAQQYLDRANNFTLSIYMRNGELTYVHIIVDVLSWDYRSQIENL
ncbi:MAG: FimB/Mfa2 family fimbrial subunit [Prevotellaceae bacterium]|nr:FimB/Mfa2 family fimbrial subunit [Prevotellaceae bacterium]